MAKQKSNGVLVVSSQVSNVNSVKSASPRVCKYHDKVLSMKMKNLKTTKDLRNFGKLLIQFLLLPLFAIAFIFIIACFFILILLNKNLNLDFI